MAFPRKAVVVIPTYDEKDDIADLVNEVLAQQAKAPQFSLHVLVSDSDSKDGTIEVVEQMAKADERVHLVVTHQRGIGVGLYNGIRYAIDELRADVLVEMDADFQHNPGDMPALLAKLAEGYEVVVASRFVEGSANQMPWYRWVMSVTANQMIRLMLGLRGVKEITTSYRAFTKEAFEKVEPERVPWQEKSFIAVPVFLVRMIESGARVTETPMTMHPRTRGYSKMAYGPYIRDILWFCLKSNVGRNMGN